METYRFKVILTQVALGAVALTRALHVSASGASMQCVRVTGERSAGRGEGAARPPTHRVKVHRKRNWVCGEERVCKEIKL